VIAGAEKGPTLWRQLTSALDRLSEPVVVTGYWRHGGGVVLHINPAWTALTGFTAAELLGQPALDVLFGPPPHAEGRSWIRTLLNNGDAASLDFTVPRRDGQSVHVRVRGSTVRFPGEDEHFLITAHVPAAEADASDAVGNEGGCKILSFGLPNGDGEVRENQRQAEALIAAQLGFQHSLEECPFGVERIDRAGRILYANPIYHDILGYDENALIGESVFERFQEPDRRRAFRTYLRHLLTKRPKATPTFTTYRRQDGTLIDLRLDWAYEFGRYGQITGLISVVTPLSDRPKPGAAQSTAKDAPSAQTDNPGGASERTADADRALHYSLYAARVWTSILAQRHPEDQDTETLGKIDKSLSEALHLLGADRVPDVPASAYYEESSPLQGQVVVVIEPSDVLRSSMLDLLQSWGCRAVGVDLPENAVDRLVRAGRLPDLIICDLALGIGLGGDSAIRLLWRRYGAGIPAVLVADEPAAELEKFAASVGMKVLRQPLHPIELRSALLGLWHEKTSDHKD